MNYWDRYDGLDSSATMEKDKVGALFGVAALFLFGVFFLFLNIVNVKDYYDDKKSGDWVVCEAEYVKTKYKEERDSEGRKRTRYFHYFEYEAPDGTVYEHVEKSDRDIKVRDSYELLFQKECYYESKMKPFEAAGTGWSLWAGLLFTIVPLVFAIIFFRTVDFTPGRM